MRYIQRFRLPARQYTPTAPVVLAAGALLEDTKLPRLVAQLKFIGLSPSPIAALTVELRCLDGGGGDMGALSFSYEGLRIRRGQAFGQYTAIVLPGEDIRSFSAAVSTVTFDDGTVWTAPEGAIWDTLPGFVPLEQTLTGPALLSLSREGLPKGRYAYAAPAGLWYCTCGGVNQDGEGTCHRCGVERDLVAQYASSGPLAALRQTRLDEATRQVAERERARQAAQAAAMERVAELKEHLKKKPLPGGKEKPKSGKRTGILAGMAGLVVVAALVILLPRFMGERAVPSSDAPSGIVETPSQGDHNETLNNNESAQNIHVTTPYDLVETAFMDVEEDGDGLCRVTWDMIEAQFPKAMFFSGSGSSLGNDIDDYIMDGYHMAFLVSSGARTVGYDSSDFSPQNFHALLLYDDQAHLYGYAIGMPGDRGGGVWRLHFTLCDYDFSSLVEEQTAAYYDSVETLAEMTYVSPEDIYDCGAAWFLRGFHTNGKDGEARHRQMYHLWHCLNSPYLKNHCRDMERFQPPRGNAQDIRYTYYLLLDEAHELIGYTMLSSEDVVPAQSSNAPAKTLHVTTPGDKGSAYIDLREDADGICWVTMDMIQEQFPQVEFFELDGVPRLGNDIDPYLINSFQMAFLVGTNGEEGGDDYQGSFSPKKAPDSARSLLLFDSKTHLYGYAIGVPQDQGNGVWRLHVTLCDYDFGPLAEEQITAYYASEKMSYIAPEDMDGGGVEWFLNAYNMRKDDQTLGHIQMYHLWSQLNSPYLEKHSRDIATLDTRRPRGDAQNPRYTYYLLLDKDYALIGYTMLNSGSGNVLPAV